jgi:hypothetical protein
MSLTTFRPSRIPVELNVLVHVGPACPQTRSLRATRCRKLSTATRPCSVLQRHRLYPGYGGRGLLRVGRRLDFRLAAGSASSFSVCTGLAGTTTLPGFALPRFWPCYRSLSSFLLKVRPYALKGYLFPTFPHFVGIQFAVRRRTRACPPTASNSRIFHENVLPCPYFQGSIPKDGEPVPCP